jgi:hypothetical protein
MPKPKLMPALVGPGRLLVILLAVGLTHAAVARQSGTPPPPPDPFDRQPTKPGAPAPAQPPHPPAQPPQTPPPQSPPAPSQPLPSPSAPAQPRTQPDNIGPEVIVFLKDGQRFTGLLVSENPERLVLRVAGIETEIGTKTIDHYQVLAPILERYRQIRDDIGEDPDRIIMLVEWLRAREQFDLALKEVNRALAIDPNKAEAKRVKRLVEEQIKLRDRAHAPENPDAAAPAPKGGPRDPKTAARTGVPLNDQQINLLKVFELNLDQPTRIVIHHDTIKRLLDENSGSALIPTTQEGRDALYRKPPAEILDLMFRLKARDLYGQVEVRDEPASMRMFRDEVNCAWLVNSCATNVCHGGQDAGRLYLFNQKFRSDTTVYTNFLILDRFRMADGRPLINYDDPQKSPLLQLGLPREDSLARHPAVPMGKAARDGWKPAFRSVNDSQFRQAVAWIDSMYKPHPSYPIDYTPPGADKGAPKAPVKEPTDR